MFKLCGEGTWFHYFESIRKLETNYDKINMVENL